MMVMTAILLVAMIGLAALAIDVGSFYQAQRQAQAAADAGALAGADALVSGGSAANTSASATATSMANTNYPSATTPTVTINGSTVTVNVHNTTPAYFGKIFGISSENVGARAVATATSSYAPCVSAGPSCYAVFAMDTNCAHPGVSANAGNVTINGGVHSNGSVHTQGSDSFGPTTYANGCSSTVGTPGPVINSWPIDYGALYPACGESLPIKCTGPYKTPSYCDYASSSPASSFSTSPTVGTYCYYGTGLPSDPSTYTTAISFNAAQVTGTFLCGTVSVTGSHAQFSPAPGSQLLFYAAAPDPSGPAVYLQSAQASYGGHIFAPRGTVQFHAGGASSSFIEAQNVIFSTGNFTIAGTGPQVPGGGATSSGVASLTG